MGVFAWVEILKHENYVFAISKIDHEVFLMVFVDCIDHRRRLPE